MKLLLTQRKLIIGISDLIEYGVWGNIEDAESWRIGHNSYILDDGYTVEDVPVDNIPTYVQEYKYYYIDGEFKLADECPNEYRERIAELEDEVIILQEENIASSEIEAELLYELSLMQLGLIE